MVDPLTTTRDLINSLNSSLGLLRRIPTFLTRKPQDLPTLLPKWVSYNFHQLLYVSKCVRRTIRVCLSYICANTILIAMAQDASTNTISDFPSNYASTFRSQSMRTVRNCVRALHTLDTPTLSVGTPSQYGRPSFRPYMLRKQARMNVHTRYFSIETGDVIDLSVILHGLLSNIRNCAPYANDEWNSLWVPIWGNWHLRVLTCRTMRSWQCNVTVNEFFKNKLWMWFALGST